MGFWIAAAVLLALAILPLGIRIRYNEAGFFLKVIVGPIKITVFPRRKKLENRKPREKKSCLPWMKRKTAWHTPNLILEAKSTSQSSMNLYTTV